MSKPYNKLVRDNIPAIIEADERVAVIRVLDDREYAEELIKKLMEEVAEFVDTPNVEEMADIQEVLSALREAMDISKEDLETTRKTKATKNGAFKKRIFLESVE